MWCKTRVCTTTAPPRVWASSLLAIWPSRALFRQPLPWTRSRVTEMRVWCGGACLGGPRATAGTCDAEVDHSWMWRLNPHNGAVVQPAVRLRLDCAGPCEPVPCAACQTGSLDTGAAHATCCALGEATRGHNAVTALVHAAAQSCDCTAETEVPGLIPGTDLRPADVLTSAPGNSYTALDISICSPHAQQARSDCTRTRREAKITLPSLFRQNISYTPIVRSACGRPHRDTLTVLRSQQIHRVQTQLCLCQGCLSKTPLQHHPGNLESRRPANPSMLAPRGPSGS